MAYPMEKEEYLLYAKKVLKEKPVRDFHIGKHPEPFLLMDAPERNPLIELVL